MDATRPSLLPGLALFLILLFAGGVMANADPMPAGDPGIKSTLTIPPDDLPSASAVKNPHGFLQFDGTSYRVVTKEVKPEQASHIRLKRVAPSKGDGAGCNVYTLEVLEQKTDEAEKKPTDAEDDGPHLAFEKVEDIDKKGVAPEPRKEHKADVGVGVKVSESSEFMVGRNLVLERKDDRRIESRDDGWRFRFKTSF